MGNRNQPNSRDKYYQGYYKPLNADKYLGNMTNIVYRSSWEYRFCQFCDCADHILKWNSEGITIIYELKDSNNKISTHRYYPDFYVEFRKPSNPEEIIRSLVEIKPLKDTMQPELPTNEKFKGLQNYEYQLKTYYKNLEKWNAAIEWCKKHNMEFLLITELFLKKHNII